jgi:hypothetical protein
MDTQTIDQEYDKLEGEFADVVKTVQALADKLQTAAKAGDQNATEWLEDLKLVVQEIGEEQTQAKVLLLTIHSFIRDAASAPATETAADEDKPPLYAPGHEPPPQPQPQQVVYAQRPGFFGGPMMGGYMGGGFARSMEMGAGIGLGETLINSIFH